MKPHYTEISKPLQIAYTRYGCRRWLRQIFIPLVSHLDMSVWSLKESFANMLLVLKQNGHDKKFCILNQNIYSYYIPINDTTLKLSVFWLSDTERRTKELGFSDSVSISFKTKLTWVTFFFGDVPFSKF